MPDNPSWTRSVMELLALVRANQQGKLLHVCKHRNFHCSWPSSFWTLGLCGYVTLGEACRRRCQLQKLRERSGRAVSWSRCCGRMRGCPRRAARAPTRGGSATGICAPAAGGRRTTRTATGWGGSARCRPNDRSTCPRWSKEDEGTAWGCVLTDLVCDAQLSRKAGLCYMFLCSVYHLWGAPVLGNSGCGWARRGKTVEGGSKVGKLDHADVRLIGDICSQFRGQGAFFGDFGLLGVRRNESPAARRKGSPSSVVFEAGRLAKGLQELSRWTRWTYGSVWPGRCIPLKDAAYCSATCRPAGGCLLQQLCDDRCTC